MHEAISRPEILERERVCPLELVTISEPTNRVSIHPGARHRLFSFAGGHQRAATSFRWQADRWLGAICLSVGLSSRQRLVA